MSSWAGGGFSTLTSRPNPKSVGMMTLRNWRIIVAGSHGLHGSLKQHLESASLHRTRNVRHDIVLDRP